MERRAILRFLGLAPVTVAIAALGGLPSPHLGAALASSDALPRHLQAAVEVLLEMPTREATLARLRASGLPEWGRRS